jgi:Sec-independent protein translocase protein TatA
MFDISFGEFSLIGLVALLVLGPTEMLKVYKSIKKFVSSIKKSIEKQLKGITHDAEDEDLIDITIDDQGVPQKAYKLDKILEKLKAERLEK